MSNIESNSSNQSPSPSSSREQALSAEEIGILILNELRALRNDMKEGGKNVRETLDNIISSDLLSRQTQYKTTTELSNQNSPSQ